MTDCAKPSCQRPATRRGLCSSHYGQRRTRETAYGRWEPIYTDAEPARLHVKELRATGLGLRRIAELAGISRGAVTTLINGRSYLGRGPLSRIARDTEDRLLAIPIPNVAHRVAAESQNVPTLGTTRRLQALVAFGYTQADLCERLGMLPTNGSRMFSSSRQTHVKAATARRVEALFNELQLTPGPSARARSDAARKGWALPMEWDEESIDDPNSGPVRLVRSSRAEQAEDIAERHEQVARLTRCGLSAQEIADRLGISQRHVVRDRAVGV